MKFEILNIRNVQGKNVYEAITIQGMRIEFERNNDETPFKIGEIVDIHFTTIQSFRRMD